MDGMKGASSSGIHAQFEKQDLKKILPAAHSFPFHIFRFKLCVTDETM